VLNLTTYSFTAARPSLDRLLANDGGGDRISKSFKLVEAGD